MKYLIVGDVHFSTYSSIVRKMGHDYSKRLENCLNSLNWVEQTAEEYYCDEIIYLGDFFDKAELTAQELTALKEVQWGKAIKHTLIVGNHEMGSADLSYSSAHILNLLPNFEVISRPTLRIGFGHRILFLPYILESDREPLSKYFSDNRDGYFETQEVKTNIIISHNDLKGIQYGSFESKEGFDLKEIESNCELFINGHLHNGCWVSNKILNLGNLTGQNFSEDAQKYSHQVVILDTMADRVVGNLSTTFIENPYAFNFYKFEVKNSRDIACILEIIKTNAVLSIKCQDMLVNELRNSLEGCSKVKDYRIVTIPTEVEVETDRIQELTAVDHIKQFKEYILSKLENSEGLLKELQELGQ